MCRINPPHGTEQRRTDIRASIMSARTTSAAVGPSRSINSITELEFGKYEIEMQSGDAIEITAEHIVFNVTEF